MRQVLHTRGAVCALEHHMIRIQARIHNTRYHALARVCLRQTCPRMYRIHTCYGTRNIIHRLHRTRQLHLPYHTRLRRYRLHLIQRHRHQRNVTAHSLHLQALCLQLLTRSALFHTHHRTHHPAHAHRRIIRRRLHHGNLTGETALTILHCPHLTQSRATLQIQLSLTHYCYTQAQSQYTK